MIRNLQEHGHLFGIFIGRLLFGIEEIKMSNHYSSKS